MVAGRPGAGDRVAWLREAIGRGAAPHLAGSLALLLLFIAVLALLWVALGLAVSIVNASLFALVIVRLYLQARRAARAPRCPSRRPGRATAPRAYPAAGAGRHRGARGARGRRLRTARVPGHLTAQPAGAGDRAPRRVGGGAREHAGRLPPGRRAGRRLRRARRPGVGRRRGAGRPRQRPDEGGRRPDEDLGAPPRRRFARSTSAATRARSSPASGCRRSPRRSRVCKGKARVVVELKSYGHDQRLEEKVAAIVEAAGMENDCIFMSLDHTMVAKMKRLRPDWRCGVLAAKAIGDLTTLDADFLAVEARMATPRFVRRAHRAGQDVYVWTVNDPAWMLAAHEPRRRRADHRQAGPGSPGGGAARRDERRAAGRGGAAGPARARTEAARRPRTPCGRNVDQPAAEEAVDARHSSHAARRRGRRAALAAVAVMSLAGTGRRPAGAPRRPQRPAGRHLPGRLAAVRSVPLRGRNARRPRPTACAARPTGRTLPRSRCRGSRAWCRPTPGPGGRWPTTATPGAANSADFQLVFYRLDPRWGDPGGPRVLETVVLRDPDRRIPWTIVCDQEQRRAAARLLVQRAARRAAGVRRRSGGPHPDRLRPRPGVVRARPRRHVLGRRGVRPVPRPRRGRRPGAGAAGPGARASARRRTRS